ncbi:MAG: hypothetical protein LBT10_02400 [Methanobrevibacter sp.]|nr:hypothetical protein [Methanobrevibacter sp.]
MKEKQHFWGGGGIFVLISSIIFVAIISYTVKPMFFRRYAVFFLGCLWLSFSIMLTAVSKNKSYKIIYIPILIIILIMGMMNTVSFVDSQNLLKTSYLDFEQCLTKINENDTIITIGDTFIANFYLKKNNIIKYENNNTTIPTEIEKDIKTNKIWIFCMTDYKQEMPYFNNFIKNKYMVEEVKKLNPMSNSYPLEIFQLKHI